MKYFIVVLLLILPACNGWPAQETGAGSSAPGEPADPVVLRINEIDYTQSQLDEELAFDRAIHYVTTGTELTHQDPVAKLDRLSTSFFIDQQAKAAGITVDESETKAALNTFVQERNISITALEAALASQGYSLDEFIQTNVARTARVEKFLNDVILAGAKTQAQQQEKLAAWLDEIKDNNHIEILYKPPEEAPLVGAVAPDFSLTNLNGETITLSQFRGQPVVVNFWATWCVPCRREMPAFQKAFEVHQGQGLVILALNLEEDAALVEPFVDELGLDFEILYDSQGQVRQEYQVTGLPRTLFIDRHGIIKHIQVGEVPEALLNGFLKVIL